MNLTDGTISTLAGSGVPGLSDGTASAAKFESPVGCALNTSSTLLVADFDGFAVRRIQIGTGAVTTLAAGIFYPFGVYVDTSYTIYVSGDSGALYRRRVGEGSFSLWVGSVAASGALEGVGTDARMLSPRQMAGDSRGNLFIGSEGGHRVYVVDTSTGALTFFAGSGNVGSSGDGLSPTSAEFSNPSAVALDTMGNVYIGQSNLVR